MTRTRTGSDPDQQQKKKPKHVCMCACVRVRARAQLSADLCVCVQVLAEDSYLDQDQDSGKPGAALTPSITPPPSIHPSPVRVGAGSGLPLIDEWKSHTRVVFVAPCWRKFHNWANFTPQRESAGACPTRFVGGKWIKEQGEPAFPWRWPQ